MIHFKQVRHLVRDEDMIEVWDDDMYIAGIYSTPKGVKVVSKRELACTHDAAYPNTVSVDIK